MIYISKPDIGKDEINSVVEVLKSGMIASGPKVKELEATFAKYCNTKYAVAFNSGTAAIHAGLYALDIKENDEVITSPFTFIASASPVFMQKAKVVFADISEIDFNLDPESVKKYITRKTKAIIPIDLYGQIYNYKEISKIAKQNNLYILEDACQSVGATQNKKKPGTFGNVAAFSLYATKNMTSGEGGLITTNSLRIMQKCKMLRHHGQKENAQYKYYDIGYNYRLTDIGAAIALAQLKKLDDINKKRIANAETLNGGLRNTRGIVTPIVNPGNKHVYHQYTIRITKECKVTRDKLMQSLREKGVGCNIYYPKPLHLHPVFTKLGYKKGDFPVAERISREVLSLPVHPLLKTKDVKFIIDSIHEILDEK